MGSERKKSAKNSGLVRELVIAYSASDIRIAEALRDVLSGLTGTEAFVDSYAKPDEKRDWSHHYRNRATADILIVINPRPDSERVEPSEAIREFSEKKQKNGRIFVVCVDEIVLDSAVEEANRIAGDLMTFRPRVLESRLELLKQHEPATRNSMQNVGREIASQLGLTFYDGTGVLGRAVHWAKHEVRHRRWMVYTLAGTGLFVTLLHALDVLNGSFDGAKRIGGWAYLRIYKEHASWDETVGMIAIPQLRARYHNASNFVLDVKPGSKVPKVGEKVDVLAIRIPEERQAFFVIIQADKTVHVMPVPKIDMERKRPLEIIPETAGPLTVLLMSVPPQGSDGRLFDAKVLEQKMTAAIASITPALEAGSWLGWNGDDYEWVFEDGGTKGSPKIAERVPEQDLYAIAVRDSMREYSKKVLFHGWTIPIGDLDAKSPVTGASKK